MAIELKIPTVGESVTEAIVSEWLKRPGDSVRQDETVVILETDKVNVELPAPASGTIKEILKDDGEEAEVGEVIGYLEEGDVESAESEGEAESDQGRDEAGRDDEDEGDEAGAEEADTPISPAARRVMAEHDLEAADIEGSGSGGRILKEDVLAHVESEDEEAPDTPEKAEKTEKKPAEDSSTKRQAKEKEPSKGKPEAPRQTPLPALGGHREEERVKMTPLRKRVAERLVQSQQQAALLTTFNEIDMSAVMLLRKQYQDAFTKRYGIKLGFMSFFVKAVIEALKEVPQVNAEVQGEEIVYRNYYDIGVAVGGGKGLVVPVIRDAEMLSFAEVEQTLAELAGRARDNKLTLDELQGGTFTISNGGIYGSLLSTPIINPPQSGILGMHKIEERPVALDGQVVIRPMMYVALTYDHRLVDGREAVTFLVRVKEGIEDPTRILLEV